MELSYLLLLITCFFYGATTLITEWDDFGPKLVNVLVIIAILVLSFITGEDGFIQADELMWLNLLIPAGAVYLGVVTGTAIDNDDWIGVFVVLSGLGLIATIITTSCGL